VGLYPTMTGSTQGCIPLMDLAWFSLILPIIRKGYRRKTMATP
jgi:hypothetical protein